MKTLNSKTLLSLAVAGVVAGSASFASAGSVVQALKTGDVSGDIRLRYESVDQDNALDDASALTVRTRLTYTSGNYNGFSAVIGMEDSRVVAGQDEYTVGPTGFNVGEYSVIADPETTELDQGYIQYKTGDKVNSFTTKLGRQVITLDGHRFVGHVGWRQDRQTFDGVTMKYKAGDLTAFYGYIDERNRIFSEDADVDASDHLFNVSYKTGIGTLTGYAYLLEDEATDTEIDTYGVSLKGSTMAGDTKVLYAFEYADQEAGSADADYMLVEGGIVVSGITAKLGYEVLGSDDGAYGFSTPLATLHKFNGWADQFLGTPATGLEDTYLSVSTKIAGGKFAVAYHDYAADEGGDDHGDEWNLLYAKKFGKIYNAGIKYASYSADNHNVDADKLWVWVGAAF